MLGLVMLAVVGLGQAGAIINGQPDGNRHPYVGLVTDSQYSCSGAAISPTLFVTAAHCFDVPGQEVFVTFDPDGVFSDTFGDDLVHGTWHPDPDFCMACAKGLPGFDTHDVAVVVFDRPVRLDRYAELPSRGLVDRLAKGTRVTNVGYGLQVREKQFQGEAYTRYVAPSQLVPSKDVISDEFLKLSANPSQGKGAICSGDSGGPNLRGDTDIILAVNSFGNGGCASVTYSYRIDTKAALGFIGRFR